MQDYMIFKINDRISELVDELSLNKFGKKSGELSSGRKIGFRAKSLINKPKILFLDTQDLDAMLGFCKLYYRI